MHSIKGVTKLLQTNLAKCNTKADKCASVSLSNKRSRMIETRKIELTSTELFILMQALEDYPTIKASGCTDSNDEQIGDEWLIELHDKLNRLYW